MTSNDIVTSADRVRLPESGKHLEATRGCRGAMLAREALSNMAVAALDLVLQHYERVQDLLGSWRASRDVHVDRNALIGSGHRRVILVEAARRGADAEGNGPLGLAHLLVDPPQHGTLPLGDRSDDNQEISLAR